MKNYISKIKNKIIFLSLTQHYEKQIFKDVFEFIFCLLSTNGHAALEACFSKSPHLNSALYYYLLPQHFIQQICKFILLKL